MIEPPFVPAGAEDAIRLLLRYLGEDPNREGLKDTPKRVINAYAEMFSGYRVDPTTIMKTFSGEHYDELVLLKDIPFTSFCEHHMLPFTGVAHIAYFPEGRIIGLSKLARLLDIYARRLQVQERITTQVTSALDHYLRPKGSACILSASHGCMSCRGVNKSGCKMVTSSLTGCFREGPLRAELFSLIGG